MRLNSRKVNDAMTKAFYAEAQSVMLESQLLVPRDTGNLASTGTVPLPKTRKGKIRVEMRYGGGRAPYAVRQHENLSYRHTSPQQAKYLEIPFFERVKTLGLRLSIRMKATLRGGAAPKSFSGPKLSRGLDPGRLPG
jgi:hypothetical protein